MNLGKSVRVRRGQRNKRYTLVLPALLHKLVVHSSKDYNTEEDVLVIRRYLSGKPVFSAMLLVPNR
jgi:hypothetical protein